MKIKHKLIAYKLLNVCVTFLFTFQSFYPFFYNPGVYAQTSDTVEVVAEVEESTTSNQIEDIDSDGTEILTETIAAEEKDNLESDDGSDDSSVVDSASDTVEEEIVTGGTENANLSEDQLFEENNKEDDVSQADQKSDVTDVLENTLINSGTEPQKKLNNDAEEKVEGSTQVEENKRLERTAAKKEVLSKDKENDTRYVDGEVLVKFKRDKINISKIVGEAKAGIFARSKKLETKEKIKSSNLALFKIKDSKSVKEKVSELNSSDDVEYAQPNYIYQQRAISTNDPSKDLLWGLDNNSDHDIDAPEAWAIDEGTNDVIVSVIDNGVAYNHEDLVSSMWDGSNCVSDSNDSLNDCQHGYDYEDLDKNPLPTDDHHGTHIAGIIAATRNNNAGILGVAPRAKIMAVKTDYTSSQVVKGINFSQYNGAKIINASWGLYGTDSEYFDQALYNAISEFPGLFIAAAGNESYNHDDGNDSHKSYPDGFKLTTSLGPGLANIIVVAATDENDELAEFSDYGINSVDVGAPGDSIYSTVNYDTYSEDFEGVSVPGLPSGWAKTGEWGTYNFESIPTKVLYGDLNYGYLNNVDGVAKPPSYSLNGSYNAKINFITKCDTEYTSDYWYDYMSLEISSNGSDFTEIDRWDEYMLDDDYDSSNTPPVRDRENTISSEYFTSNFTFRFRWHSDELNIPDIDYDGCFIDNLQLRKYSNDLNNYDYGGGTSFAAPYVSGLAALLWSVAPELTTEQVKTAILEAGDPLSSLDGKTTTGKRINAQYAMISINNTKEITSFAFEDPNVSGIINSDYQYVIVYVPYGTDVTSLTPIITYEGESISPESGEPQDFSEFVYYTITAANGTTIDWYIDVRVEDPSAVTTVSSSIYTVSSDTISNVPYGTSKITFLSNLTKDDPNQSWDDSGINDPILTGDELVIAAEDGTTTRTYTISVEEVAPVLDPIGNKVIDELSLLSFTATSTDPDGPSTIYYLTDEPSGAFIDGTSGEFTFTPTESQGPDVYNLTVWVTDGSNTDSEEISITVNEVNLAPFSAAVSDSLDEDTNKLITLDAIDNDIPSNTLTYSIVSNPTDGTLGTISGNEVRYTPNPDFNGGDSFTYKANDEQEDSNTATVDITVNPINDAPTANDDSYNTQEDTPVLITLTGNDIDGDSLSFNLLSTPSHGSLEILSGEQMNYIPDENYAGGDSLTFKANDGQEDSNIATINITVNGVNDTPVLDSIGDKSVDELDTLSFTATASDPDSTLTYSLINAPSGASIGPSSGVFSFSPNETQGPNVYTLTVSVTDGNTSDEEEIDITVNEVNVAPVVSNFSVSIDEDTEKVISLGYTDPDLPENSITHIIGDFPTNGSLSAIVNGQVTYTPNEHYNGSDSFTYKVNDGSVDSNIAEVTINVTSINDAPVAKSDNISVNEDSLLIIPKSDLLSNDTDVDDEHSVLDIVSVQNPINGTVYIDGDNLVFTPSQDYYGSAGFEYTVSDGYLSDNTNVGITVNAVNDAPVASPLSADTDENNPVDITLSGTDIEEDVLSYSLTSYPLHGDLNIVGNIATYTPETGFSGTDSFYYVANDGYLNSESVEVSITIIDTVDNPVDYQLPESPFENGFIFPSYGAFTHYKGMSQYGAKGRADSGKNYNDILNFYYNSTPVNIDDFPQKICVEGYGDMDFQQYLYGVAEMPSSWNIEALKAQVVAARTYAYSYTDSGQCICTTQVCQPFIKSKSDNPPDSWKNAVDDTKDEILDLATAINPGFYSSTTGGYIDGIGWDVDGVWPDNAYEKLAGSPWFYKAWYTKSYSDNDTCGRETPWLEESEIADMLNSYVVWQNGTTTEKEHISPLSTECWGGDPYSMEEMAEKADIYGSKFTDVRTVEVEVSNNGYTSTIIFKTNLGIVYLDGATFKTIFNLRSPGYIAIRSRLYDAITNITSDNFAPDAQNDSVFTDEDNALIIPKVDLLANDTDIDGDTLSIISTSSAVNGAVTMDENNTTFTPDPNFNGTAYFDYTMTDGEFSDSTTVTVTVNPVNDAPTANDGYVDVEEDSSLIITLTGNDVDGDNLTFAVVDNPSNGSLGSVTGNQVEYTPNVDYEGSDSFTFKANDGLLDSNTATINITINEYNDPPILDPIGNKSTDELIELTFTANATDPDSVVTYHLSGEPIGAVIDSNSGLFSFTPTELQGPQVYTLDINVTDGNSTDSETINVTVNEVNVNPVANDKNAVVDEDQSVEITLEGNDADIPAQSLSYIKVTDPSNGAVTFNGDKANYSPNGDFFGSDSFTYKVNDSVSDSNVATVNITVSAVNDAPVANPDTASVDEDNTLTVSKATLISNDTDVDDASLVLVSVANPSNGTVFIDGDNVIFNPSENYNGKASFEYSVSDGSLSDTTTVTVTVNPINDAPTVDDAAVITDEDNSISMYLSGNDVDGDALSYLIIDSTTSGTLGGPYNNQVLYTPNEDFNGTDSFAFKANDGTVDSNIGIVTISVNSVNDAPELNNIGNKTVDELTNLNFIVTASDDDMGDILSFSMLNAPVGALIDGNTGEFNFTPTENQGPNTYNVTINVSDGEAIDSEEIEISVNEVNVAPISFDVVTSTNEDTSKTIVLNSTDEDIPENSLTYIVESGVSHGTLGTISGNEVVYTPSENFNGEDSFTYKVNDGSTDSNTSTVTITIIPINDAPVANTDSSSTDEDNDLTILKADLLANDTDVDFDTLSLVSVSNANNGVANIDGANVVFSPSENFNGSASFDYTVSDGVLTDIATVNITVNAVNDAPTTRDDAYTTTQEAPIDITLLGNDLENDSLSYSVMILPANGSLSVISGNQVTYTPDMDYVGDDSFTYKTNDGEYDSNESTIDITVYPPPVISEEASSEIKSTSITITWTTDHPSTSRVIYDTVSHPTLGTAPNYGYAYSTIETDNSPMVISHSVTVDALSPNTTYYFRPVSHGSPEIVGDEISFTTKIEAEEDTEAPDRPENVELTYNSEDNTIKVTWENNDGDIDEVSVYMGYDEDFDKNSESRITQNDYDDEDVTVYDIEPGRTYYFKLVAEDKAGNDSKTRTVSIEIPEELDKEVIVTDISDYTIDAADEDIESSDEVVLGSETNQNEEKIYEDTAESKDEIENSNSGNGFKYFLVIGFILIIGLVLLLKKRK